ncbi:hypothetical protein EDC01DRAFT_681983 [Geopyxis carbonaria]|nr:hypothetical protein EDC01DRAFT_681983 [Geopyxis carbonaria]
MRHSLRPPPPPPPLSPSSPVEGCGIHGTVTSRRVADGPESTGCWNVSGLSPMGCGTSGTGLLSVLSSFGNPGASMYGLWGWGSEWWWEVRGTGLYGKRVEGGRYHSAWNFSEQVVLAARLFSVSVWTLEKRVQCGASPCLASFCRKRVQWNECRHKGQMEIEPLCSTGSDRRTRRIPWRRRASHARRKSRPLCGSAHNTPDADEWAAWGTHGGGAASLCCALPGPVSAGRPYVLVQRPTNNHSAARTFMD